MTYLSTNKFKLNGVFPVLLLFGGEHVNKIIISFFVTFLLLSTTAVITGQKVTVSTNNKELLQVNNQDIIPEMLEQLDEEMMLGYIEDLVEIAEKHSLSRLTGTEGCEEARDYILNEFFETNLQTNILDWADIGTFPPYQHLLFVSENIEAKIPGKQGSNEIIVIMAHYDTVANSPSADDNSAGIAAVLSAAKIMSQYEFNHEIRFILVSGEEEGLLGSNAYAENAYDTCESIVTVINLDMIGYSSPDIEGDENKVRIYETCSTSITDNAIDICNNPDYSKYFNFEVFASDDDTGHGSDQRSFCNHGFDSIFIHEYTWNDNKDRGTDTIENMDTEYATRVARLAMAVIAKYALDPIIDNDPPNTPSKVEGPEDGKINEEQEYTTSTTDPDGDQVYYMFDWDDGTHSNWLGPYESGEQCIAKHTYTEEGEYKVKAKAKDIHGIQSKWKEAEKSPRVKQLFLSKLFEANPIFSNILKQHLQMHFPWVGIMLKERLF